MTFIFGNLPDGTTEKDIKDLTHHYKPSKVEFLNKNSKKHSSYECMVTLEVTNPIIGCLLEQHYNNHVWKGSNISVHRLIF